MNQKYCSVLLYILILITTSILYLTKDAKITSAQTSSDVNFELTDLGLKSLKYNGITFASASAYSQIVNFATFLAPDGTKKSYGWLDNAIGGTVIPAAEFRSTGTNPDYFQHIYRSGQDDSFTLKMVWSKPDNRTAKVDIYVTNNDQVDILDKIAISYWLGGDNNFFIVPDLAPRNSLWWSVGTNNVNTSQVAFVKGNTWGSVAFYTDNYSSNSKFSDVWTNDYLTSGTSNPYKMLFGLSNYDTTGGPDISNVKSDQILPGATWHYTLYIRFGTLSDTPGTLAPEAYSSFREVYPYIINWSDRRPIGRWFIGDGARNSATNPRSYLWDSTLDVYPLTPAKQEVFNTRILKQADDIIKYMDAMNPKPQGILIWDLEGDEFVHYLTYVGSPNKIADLAPEMDAVSNQLLSKFVNAGYNVGLTLRPSTIKTGTVLPETCNSDPTNVDIRDVFIKTDAIYPNRGYECTSTNVWTQAGARKPYHQTCSLSDDVILSNLREKVSYAKNRWGVKMFYVDSTVYCGNGGGNPISFKIFYKLQKEFPDVLFMPENVVANFWSASAPYMDVSSNASLSGSNTPTSVKYIYPNAFTTINPIGAGKSILYEGSTLFSNLVQAVKDGNILLLEAWYAEPMNLEVLKIYQQAGVTTPNTPTTPTAPVVTTIPSVPVTPPAPVVPNPVIIVQNPTPVVNTTTVVQQIVTPVVTNPVVINNPTYNSLVTIPKAINMPPSNNIANKAIRDSTNKSNSMSPIAKELTLADRIDNYMKEPQATYTDILNFEYQKPSYNILLKDYLLSIMHIIAEFIIQVPSFLEKTISSK